MTTNTNPSRTARFAASTAPVGGFFHIIDRTDGMPLAAIKGRAAARSMAAQLNAINPTDEQGTLRDFEAKAATDDDELTTYRSTAGGAYVEVKAEAKRTSHADCAHVSTKLARAICRRDRAKADA